MFLHMVTKGRNEPKKVPPGKNKILQFKKFTYFEKDILNDKENFFHLYSKVRLKL